MTFNYVATTIPDIHFAGGIGASLKDGRYTVLRKLGQGETSTIWLVSDSYVAGDTIHKYHAAKILGVKATSDPHGPSRERDFLQLCNERRHEEGFDEGAGYTTLLLDSFEHVGVSGRHLCLISPVFSTSVAALRDASPDKRLPVHMVRNIVYMALSALKSIHGMGIVHCDVKPDNMLFTNDLFTDPTKLEAHLSQNPVQMVPGAQTPESQPLPHGWTHETSADESKTMTIVLTDFGDAEQVGGPHLSKMLSTLDFCANATLLYPEHEPPSDIWALGHLTFELLVGRSLLDSIDAARQLSTEEEQLRREGKGEKYFDQDGNLNCVPAELISNYNIAGLEDGDITKVSDFIRACMHLDLEQRPSAAQLLEHSFLEGASSC
ncbi:kinase-like domain-containing protein [Pterulicium gracile]|uniref:non-specific serine/threonine protein kinase n=1 Tax=Pterulicium gracile TaxID=1884261 RepID=A0A5C3QES6_9AGAR|nr:kinase-like domain-containing protein [Pterula gracilis]